MDLCRANERNAAALTLTSIGQQQQQPQDVKQECVSPTTVPISSSDLSRARPAATWLLVDSAEHAVVAQQHEASGTINQHPEPNNNVNALVLGEGWMKQEHQQSPTEDGRMVYAEVIQPMGSNRDGIVLQSM